MTHDLPPLALSVRQPWAYAIIHQDKDHENRAWGRAPSFRGRVAIHASSGMTPGEYDEARDYIDTHCYTSPTPDPAALFRGGIIGSVEIVDWVSESDSWWFMGPRALVLRDPRPCPFVPCKGALGFFEWQPGRLEDVPKPAKWMRTQPPNLRETIKRLQPAPDMFGGEK